MELIYTLKLVTGCALNEYQTRRSKKELKMILTYLSLEYLAVVMPLPKIRNIRRVPGFQQKLKS